MNQSIKKAATITLSLAMLCGVCTLTNTTEASPRHYVRYTDEQPAPPPGPEKHSFDKHHPKVQEPTPVPAPTPFPDQPVPEQYPDT